MEENRSKPIKHRSKTLKIRRLGEATDKSRKKSFKLRVFSALKMFLVALPLALIIFCFVCGPIMDFTDCYQKQYNKIIYDSCKPQMDTTELLRKINEHQILHQTDALQRLEQILKNDSKMTSVAFVGKPGVGKSLVAKAFVDSFTWHTNVLHYFWNTHVKDDVEKFQMVRYFLNRLSGCGRNLLIIDNLVPCDNEIVTIFQQLYGMVQKEQSEYKFFGEGGEKYLIVVFLFSLDTMEENVDTIKTQYEMLQKLPNTTTINFRDFDDTELKSCISREASLQNITLTESSVAQILGAINPRINGCKNVRAKLLMYGT